MIGSLILDRHQATPDEEATALFSPCRTFRYALTRRWNPDRPVVAFVLLNPSTADAYQLDPTLRRCAVFARTHWGAGGFTILNLFALRSTNPRVLYAHPDPVGVDNDRVIADTVAGLGGGPVVCGWGVHGAHGDRAGQVEGLLRDLGVRPLCLGVTKGGHPRHPLYVAGATKAVEYLGPP